MTRTEICGISTTWLPCCLHYHSHPSAHSVLQKYSDFPAFLQCCMIILNCFVVCSCAKKMCICCVNSNSEDCPLSILICLRWFWCCFQHAEVTWAKGLKIAACKVMFSYFSLLTFYFSCWLYEDQSNHMSVSLSITTGVQYNTDA